MHDIGIYYLIYSGKKKTIIWANIIQVGGTDTDLPFLILLWNDHHIFQSVWIFNFPDESGCQQFVNLNLDDHLPVRMQASNLLVDGS